MKSSIKKILCSLGAVSALFFAGCAGTQYSYEDSGSSRNFGTHVGSYDIQMNAEALVNDMLSNPVLARKLKEKFPGKRPIISCLPIVNQTRQMGISNQLGIINNKIAMKLTNTDKFEFMELPADNQHLAKIYTDIINNQVRDDRTDVLKQQDRPDLILSGRIVEIRESNGRVTESYYSLTMELTNLLTAKKEWIGENEIRKAAKKPAFGF